MEGAMGGRGKGARQRAADVHFTLPRGWAKAAFGEAEISWLATG